MWHPVLTRNGFKGSMVNILLFGANGQVGWELCRSLLPVGELTALAREHCDFTNKDMLVNSVREVQPDIIVNAAAYTAVDKAEEDVATAQLINTGAPAILADEAKSLGALLVDYSTDYVFDGTKQEPYVETDEINPLNEYGRSKLAGQHAIENSGCRHLIFRVSWVYSSRGNNFVKTMLRLGEQRNELRVVSDQVGSPTPADLIADVTAQALTLIRTGKGEEGLFNLVPAGETSWYGFADEIFSHAAKIRDFKAPELAPVSTSEYPAPARRPLNSRLDTAKLEHAFGVCMPAWQIPMKRIIEEII